MFDVAAARAVFQLVTGPVEARLLSAKTLIVDPSGPLRALPIGVLVTDQASVDRFKASRLRDRLRLQPGQFPVAAGGAVVGAAARAR